MNGKRELRQGEIVFVDWLDSQSFTGWRDSEDASEIVSNPERLKIQSVGYLIHQDKQAITIAQSSSETQFCDGITIPRCSIKSIRSLENRKRRKHVSRK